MAETPGHGSKAEPVGTTPITTTISTIPTRQQIATDDDALRVSRLRKSDAGETARMATRTHVLRGKPSAEKQSAATMRYEAAHPTQLMMTAKSISSPEFGSAASHTVANVAGALTFSPLLRRSFRLREQRPAEAMQSSVPEAKPPRWYADGSARMPVPMQVEARLMMHEATDALPPEGEASGRASWLRRLLDDGFIDVMAVKGTGSLGRCSRRPPINQPQGSGS